MLLIFLFNNLTNTHKFNDYKNCLKYKDCHLTKTMTYDIINCDDAMRGAGWFILFRHLSTNVLRSCTTGRFWRKERVFTFSAVARLLFYAKK